MRRFPNAIQKQLNNEDKEFIDSLSSNRKRFSEQEESHLINLAHQGDERALELLLESYQDAIISIAKMYIKRGLPFSELYPIGVDALKEYFKVFNNNKFAVWNARQAMLKAILEKSEKI